MRVLVTGGSGFIGTHVMNAMKARGPLLNVDIAAPNEKEHRAFWVDADIMDAVRLESTFSSFKPEVVIHLAARTDTDSDNLDDYAVNTTGTQNVLDAVARCSSVERLIHTSTQFVNQYKGQPAHDLDFAPHTVYGESKVVSEKMLRAANLSCHWTIIRPTNIWGPWHKRYPYEFWSVLARGLYVHPGWKPVIRSYGYVGNVAHQIAQIVTAPANAIHGKVFYVGDEPIELFDWVNGFSKAQLGRAATRVPRAPILSMAVLGDVLKRIGLRFPITTSRYRSMTHENYIDMTRTFAVCGAPPLSLEEGIAETVSWMRDHHPHLIRP